MSKKRDKKTPMFVSNINSNYDFVDYTVPEQTGQPAPSTFGNPNIQPPGTQSPQKLSNGGPQQSISPKKPETNWFEQMLQTQDNKNVTSPTAGKTGITPVENKSPQGEFYRQNNNPNSNQVNPGFQLQFQPPPQVNSPHRPQPQLQNFQPSFKKQQAPQNPGPINPVFQQNTIGVGQNIQNPLYTNNNSRNYPGQPQQFQQPPQNINVSSFQKKNYEFNTSTFQQTTYQANNFNPSFQSPQNTSFNQTSQSKVQSQNKYETQSKFSSGGYSSGLTEETKPKIESSSYRSTSTPSSNSGGYTDESIVDCLPEPARSNILAMIRRSKGLSN